jgi:hypothetical protein
MAKLESAEATANAKADNEGENDFMRSPFRYW